MPRLQRRPADCQRWAREQRYIAAFTRVFERYIAAHRNNFAVQYRHAPGKRHFLTTAGRPAINMTTTTKPLEWKPLWDAMDATPTEWIETTAGMYWEMLECLPPRAIAGGRFLVGEPLRHVDGHAVHACFWERADGTFWARNLTVAEFHGAPPTTNGAHAAKAP